VQLRHGDKGGKLEIRYRTLDQLDSICYKLAGISN
jgi:ParB family chromosome partitioning protein